MAKNNEKNQEKTPNNLPEFLDEQGQLKEGLRLPDNIEQLQHLQHWLAQREKESSRRTRPAWIEVVQSLINLSQQSIEKGERSVEQHSNETHLVARQAARQRNERGGLATRFVSDELRRICTRQRECLQNLQDPGEPVVILGWFRSNTQRGLGIALADYKTALALCACEEEELAHFTDDPVEEIDLQPMALSATSSTRTVGRSWLGAGIGFLSAVALCVSVYFGFLDKPVRLQDKTQLSEESKLGGQTSNKVKDILDRGYLLCGVDGLLKHFSVFNDTEQMWWGLDAELCKALGAALEVQVRFVKVSASRFSKRIERLEKGDVDILFRNTTHTISRDLNHQTTFGPVYFYERESFLDLAPLDDNKKLDPHELEGKKICVKPGTSNQRTLERLQSNLSFDLVTNFDNKDLNDNVILMRALRKNTALCDFVFGNYHVLLQLKKDQKKRSRDTILRQLSDFGLDPLAPVLKVDERWRRVVSHTIYALMYADELGINSFNIEKVAKSNDKIRKEFLQGSNTAKPLQLSEKWVQRVIEKVGSYNEIYYRSIVCEYAYCEPPNELSLKEYLKASEGDRWPNKLFKHDDLKPGMLVVPRF